MVTGPDIAAGRLAGMFRAGQDLAGELRQVMLDRDGQDGLILARRLVEDRWAGGCAYPSGADYWLAARELAGLGYAGDAELLRAVASTERYLVRHESRWHHRYDGYAHPGTAAIRAQVRDGVLALGKAQRGIDGARYLAGRYAATSPLYGTSVVLVSTRAGSELLTDWESPAAAGEWACGRLPSASGPLPPPGGRVPRLGREEQVLAFVLRYPWELDAVAAALPGYVFTADIRDEVFAAARTLHSMGGTVTAGTVAAEVDRRSGWAPLWAREMLGGSRAPLAPHYVRRLAATDVGPATAQDAIGELGRSCQAADTAAVPRRPGHALGSSPRQEAMAHAPPWHTPSPAPSFPAPRL